MRIWSFVLLEVVAGATSFGAVFAARHWPDQPPPVALRAELAATSLASTSLELPPPAASLDPEAAEVTTDVVGTFLGMRDELLIDRMHVAEVVRAKLNKGGSSISFRIDFADGSRAAFKPEQINPQTVPRKEVAAYRINRALGLHAVPPATMRTLHHDDLVGKLPPEAHFLSARIEAETLFDDEGFTRGELSYWIPTIIDSHLDADESVVTWTKWMTVGEALPPDKANLMQQLSSLLVFDMLTNNSDRFSGGNLMTSPDWQTLYWMDNTFGFQVEPEGHIRCRAYLSHCQKFSRRLIAALRSFDLAALRRALAAEPDILSAAEMGAVIGRRDAILRYVDGLSAQLGSDQVLVFP